MTETREYRAPARHPELEGEAEVDLGRYVSAVALRWWLPLLGLIVGALLGWLVSVGGEQVWRASALVYPGQTLSPSGTAPIQSLATNPATIREIVRSEFAVRRVARETGYPPARLRRSISVATATGPRARVGQAELVNVIVTGDAPRRTADAANALAKLAVADISGYVNTKIDNLEAQIAADTSELAVIERQVQETAGALEGEGLSGIERLTALNLALLAQQRRTTVQQDLADRQQLLSLALNVERARIVEPAVARQVTARSRRNTLVVAAVLGLLLGLAAALAWDPVAARVRRA